MDHHAQRRQVDLHRVPDMLRGDVFIVVTVDVARPDYVPHAIDGCRTFISAGRRREASEMISRQRATVYMVQGSHERFRSRSPR